MATSLRNVVLGTLLAGEVRTKCSVFLYMQLWNNVLFLITALVPIMNSLSNWTSLQSDWNEVRAWAEEKGATDFAAVGELAKMI